MKSRGAVVGCAFGLLACASGVVVDAYDRPPVVEVSDGDYILPRISPDGARLAFVEVVVLDDRESSQLWVMDLESGSRTLLVDDREVSRHGYYLAWTVALEWLDDRALKVSIHDGDVGVTELTVDSESGATIVTEVISGPIPPLSPRQVAAAQRMRELFPELESNLVAVEDQVFLGFHLFLSPDSILFRRAAEVAGRRIGLADLREGTLGVVDSGSSTRGWITGGIALNAGAAILFRRVEGAVEPLRYSDGELETLDAMPGGSAAYARELSRTASEVVFLLRTHRPSEVGTNHLLVFDGEDVRPLLEREGLVDADLATTTNGRLLATSVWRGERRVVEVFR